MHGRGFTLIELMVVLVIMTVFTGLALPRLVEQGKSARKNACFSDFATMVGAAKFRAVETGVRQEVVIDMERDAISLTDPLTGDKSVLISKKLPSGLWVDSVQTGTQKVGHGSKQLPFYPDGTSVYALIAIQSNDTESMIFTLDGATGTIAVQQ